MNKSEIGLNFYIPQQNESPNVFFVEDGITKRKGRLNTIELIDDKSIRKTGIVSEEVRPNRLKIEAWALSEAKSRGVNVPSVIDYYQNGNGQEVILMERIHGKTLSHYASEDNASCLLSVGNQMNLLENVSGNYGWIDPRSMTGKSKDWKTFILSYTQIYGEALVKDGVIARKDLRCISEAIQETDLNTSPYLVHRDIKLDNLIRDGEGKTWIIDWENVMLGDPLYDLAIFGLNHKDILWENLAITKKTNYDRQKYILYETIASIGLIDFCCRNKIDFKDRQKQLYGIMAQSELISSKRQNNQYD